MDTIDLDEKLTDAARQVLNELTEDYRNQILRAAVESASRATGEVREISVQDVLGALRKVSTSPRSWRPSPIERILNLYMLLGLFLGISGFGFFAFRDVFMTIEPQNRVSLLIGAAGFMMAIFSFFLLRLKQLQGWTPPDARESRDAPAPDLIGLYISRWQQIELALRSIASSRLGESHANEPLSALLARLQEERTLTDEDTAQLRQLLETRNQLVHRGVETPTKDITTSLREAERILSKLGRQTATS